MVSPYDVLLIDVDADEEEIKWAYRRRVIETHPDQGGSAREFQSVKAAYEAIKSGHGNGEPDAGRENVEEHHHTKSRVEYLNYEVLDDHGWSLDDEDLFENASVAGLDTADYGRILVRPDESLLQAAENRGFRWPYACRGGACANCAVAVLEGEMEMPVNNILPPEIIDRRIRLSCNGMPATEEMKIVYNVNNLSGLDELRLPPRPFKQAYASD